MYWINRPRAEDLLAQVLKKPHSSFYRDRYARAGLDPDTLTVDDFSKLPLLSRRELTDVPITARTFTRQEEICTVAFTSGTSSNMPLSIPFSRIEKYSFEPSLGCKVSRALVLLPPIMKAFGTIFIRVCEEAKYKVTPVHGDIKNMANSAFIAKAAACDSLWALPTIASAFAPYAKEQNIAQKFRLIVLSGETITSARRMELHSVYPNALIGNVYGSSEFGPILFTCPTMMRSGNNKFHTIPEDFAAIEIIEGELVLSYGLNQASPFVRYRTGDYFDEVPGGCPCGLLGPVIEWSHRSGVDRLRVNGMAFDVEEADRAFAVFPHVAGKEYQAHFYPVPGRTAVALKIEIADPAASADETRSKELAAFAERELPAVWKLSATATVQTALENGSLASFSVSVVPTLSESGKKLKRFINHVV